jgi:hypothetical protein
MSQHTLSSSATKFLDALTWNAPSGPEEFTELLARVTLLISEQGTTQRNAGQTRMEKFIATLEAEVASLYSMGQPATLPSCDLLLRGISFVLSSAEAQTEAIMAQTHQFPDWVYLPARLLQIAELQ